MEFPVLFYTGVIKRWKKKSLLFVEEGFKLIDKSVVNLKTNEIIYPLRNAIIKESLKNKKTLEITLVNRRIIIQAFSPKEKQIIKEKLKEHISKINENNCFSKEFEDYVSEINKIEEENESDDIFRNVENSVSLLINFFLELNQKLDDLKTLVDSVKFNKTNKDNFLDCCNKLSVIENKMKVKFDELVKDLYDYRDFIKPMINDEITKEVKKRKYSMDAKTASRSTRKNYKNKYSLESPNDNEQEPEDLDFVPINDSPKIEKKELKFCKDIYYDFPTRFKLEKKIEVNNNMIPEIVKVFTSGQKILPIKFNEPLNVIQRECEKFMYCYLLDKAVEEKQIEMKFAYIAAFITSEMSLSIGRVLKPMIPLVGETYEYVDNKLAYRFFGEEVQRSPNHISAFFVESEKWKLFGDNRNTTGFKFFTGSFAIEFGSKLHLQLINNINDNIDKKYLTFIYNRPSTILKGILINKLHYDYNGKVEIKCLEYPDILCTIDYLVEGKNINEGDLSGKITKGGEDNVIYNINGNWKKEIYITDSNKKNKKILFKVLEEDFFNNTSEKYVIPMYSCNLNVINDKLKEILPLTDTRFRPDQKEYEIGDTAEAEEIKKKIEDIQIYNQEISDAEKKEHIPIYFSNEYSEESGDFVYMYKGGYWEDRANKKFGGKMKNIFDVSNYEMVKEALAKNKEKNNE